MTEITPYEKDRNNEAQAVYLIDGQCPDCRRTFKMGSDWGKKWNEEKGTGNVIEFMKNTQDSRIKRLEEFCDHMASFIKNRCNKGVGDSFEQDRKELLNFWYGTMMINPQPTNTDKEES